MLSALRFLADAPPAHTLGQGQLDETKDRLELDAL
jgi:hypothetical protein